MERVQHSLEASLPELKDLQTSGIFSGPEIKEIIRRRTNYELQLVRRQPRKKDFLDYIEYEMALERLRRKRVAQLEKQLPHSLSSHSLIQKQFSIFERATRKFKADIRLWVQYIDLAKKEGAGNLVGRVVAKALKLHPSSIPLYILAAQHELDQSSPSAARNLLQRGIRLNNESVDLWCEYVKMELGWCEFLKRRWETLGIQPSDRDPEASSLTANVDAEAARKEVLNGAIVKEVIKNALQALPSLKTFDSLLQALRSYPTPLSKALIPFLFEVLIQVGSMSDANRAQIRAVYSTRHLLASSGGPAFVKGLKLANEELKAECLRLYQGERGDHTHPSQEEGPLTAFAHFISQQWEAASEGNLRLYLSSSLYNICHTVLQNPLPGNVQGPGRDAVFSTHLRILLDSTHPEPHPTSRQVLKLARQYSLASNNPAVWLQRLEAEQRFSSHDSVTTTTSSSDALRVCSRLARSRCQGGGVESIWTWGWHDLTTAQREAIIKESLSLPLDSHTMGLRTVLLLQTLSSLYQSISTSSLDSPSNLPEAMAGQRLKTVSRLLRSYLPSPEVYKHAFDLERALPSPKNPKPSEAGESSARILEYIYLLWRDHSASSKEDATFAYAAYLLDSDSIGEATRLVNNLMATAPFGEAREAMEKRWKGILERDPAGGEGDANMETDDAANSDRTSDDDSSDVDFVVYS